MHVLTCLTMSNKLSVLAQKTLPSGLFSIVESGDKVEKLHCSLLFLARDSYWTWHYSVASTAWFIPIYSAKTLSGSVYSPLLPSVLKNNSHLLSLSSKPSYLHSTERDV